MALQDSHDTQAEQGLGSTPETHASYFGEERVGKEHRQRFVNDVFGRVFSKYDVMNDVMSLGAHRIWKRVFCALVPLCAQEGPFLDVASGTGDIAARLSDRFPHAPIALCDISSDMLLEARKRFEPDPRFSYIEASAECLPFEDETFSLYSISFGLRNVTDIAQALKEGFRVLKKDGVLMCMEFSKPLVPLLEKACEVYYFRVIPKLGHIIAGDEAAYRYLVESIKRFPNQTVLSDMIEKAGFQDIDIVNLFGGAVAIHVGFKR